MKFKQLLTESINDKHLFKVIFMAGGPGSGKSFINDLMFGGIQAKVVNSDNIFETQLKKNNMPLTISDKDIEVYQKQMAIRDKSKKLTFDRKHFFIDGMLPIIIDGTGRDYKQIKRQKEAFEKLGYDTGMVFVNTSLDVAKQRNLVRKRIVPDSIVEKGWYSVQKNIGKFQSLFNNYFKVVDNNDILDKKGVSNLGIRLHKNALKFFDVSVQNKIGQNTIKLLTKTGGKYLSDLPDGMIE